MSKRKKKIPKFYIQKRSKKFEAFSEEKYLRSLRKSGLSKLQQDQVFCEVRENIKDYFSTALLHRATYKAILRCSRLFAANYDIKRSIYNLGPTGYPFEILCSEMLKAKGFKTKVSVIKKGKCVKHEVDVVARRKDFNLFCECKYHAKKYHKNDIKVPLYVHSRYLDVKEGNPGDEFQYAVISNTDFSKDAISYAKGVGLLLYSMNYPKRNTFIDIIRKYKVYPISALKSLRVKDRKDLLEKGIVVVKQVDRDILLNLSLTDSQMEKILQEVKILTRPN